MTTVNVSRCACGSDTRQLYSFKDKAECAEHMRWMERGYQVQCGINFCGLRGPTCDTEDEAIDGWNRMQAALALSSRPSRSRWPPTDSGIPELDSLCAKYNAGEIDLLALTCRIWNKALSFAPPTNDEAPKCLCGQPVEFCGHCETAEVGPNDEAVRLLHTLVEELIQGGESDETRKAAIEWYYRNDPRHNAQRGKDNG